MHIRSRRQRRIAFVVVALVALGAWALAARLNGGRSATPTSSSGSAANARAVLKQTPSIAADPNATVGLRTGDLAPNFEASDLAGKRFMLSDLRGHPLVVNFWASWCTSCAAELPALQALERQHAAEGLRVLLVNMGDDAATARDFLRGRGVDLRVALDPNLALSRAYRVTGLPVSYFLGAHGIIRAVRFGEMSPGMMNDYAARILSAPPRAESATPAAASTAQPAATARATLGQATVKLTVGMFGPGTLVVQSPSLRCGAGFCAGYLLLALQGMPGVLRADSRVFDQRTGDWGFVLTYDQSRVTPLDVIATYDRSLTAHPDPLYPLPHRVDIVQVPPSR